MMVGIYNFLFGPDGLFQRYFVPCIKTKAHDVLGRSVAGIRHRFGGRQVGRQEDIKRTASDKRLRPGANSRWYSFRGVNNE